jgi:hypothetical protein
MSLPGEAKMTGHPPSVSQGTEVIGYHKLTEVEIEKMNLVKKMANDVGAAVDALMLDGTVDTRWIAIGKTQLQQGFMAINRGIAKPDSF